MARHLRVQFPGAIYHVTCRMIGDGRLDRSRLFRDDRDRERFLGSLADRVEQYSIRLYLFVLMTNHFHLVFETPEGNCSKFMQSLLTAYTVYYNRRRGRHGHLLDGRYKAKLVEGDEYLSALSRYVHLNPARVGAIQHKPIAEKVSLLRRYAWSSYPSYVGRRKALDFVDYGPILAGMKGKRPEWRRRYREFVEAGLAEDDEDFKAVLAQSPRSIGGDAFRAWVDELHEKLTEGRECIEDISFRHVTEPLPAETILAAVSDAFGVKTAQLQKRLRNSPLRAVAGRMLIRFGGLTQREVATQLAMGTGGAVSAQVRRLPGLLAEDRPLRKAVEKLEQELEGLKRERAGRTP